MTAFLRRLWGSLGFRMASYYGLLVAITLLASFGIVYMQTVGVTYQRMTRHVASVGQQLSAHYGEGGTAALVAAIERDLTDDVNSDSEIYLLTDAQGRKIAGNIESLVRSASTAAGVVALVLLVGATLIFRQELDRTIAALRRTAARVGAGELQHRVEVSGGGQDEFALLHRDVNEMLDRVELLMNGVRHVSDTIAHNLRTPLTHITLRLHAAEDPAAPPAERQAAITAAAREIGPNLGHAERGPRVGRRRCHHPPPVGAW